MLQSLPALIGRKTHVSHAQSAIDVHWLPCCPPLVSHWFLTRFSLVQGSQLPAGIEFAGRYLIQQDRQRTGSSATVLAHDKSHQNPAEEGPAEVGCPALPCLVSLISMLTRAC